MRRLLVLALLLTVPSVPASAASPKPRPRCTVTWSRSAFAQVVPEVDVRGADVAAGRTEILVVLRLARADLSNPLLTAGAEWDVRFDAAGDTVRAVRPPGISPTATPSASNSTVTAFWVDPAFGTLVWAVPRKAFPNFAGCSVQASAHLVGGAVDV
jgi:hypothetical protein